MTPIRRTLDERNLAHHAEVRKLPHVITNSLPIPFFGDVEAYEASDIHIVTAALNPSREEFPADGSARFDLEAGCPGRRGSKPSSPTTSATSPTPGGSTTSSMS